MRKTSESDESGRRQENFLEIDNDGSQTRFNWGFTLGDLTTTKKPSSQTNLDVTQAESTYSFKRIMY